MRGVVDEEAISLWMRRLPLALSEIGLGGSGSIGGWFLVRHRDGCATLLQQASLLGLCDAVTAGLGVM